MECKHSHVSTMFCIVLTASFCMLIQAADPVYSPDNLTDTSGNFAFRNGTVIWADLPTGEAYEAVSVSRISAGLKGFYSMVHGFIVAVLPKSIPDEIIENILQGETSEVLDKYNNYISFFIGYFICMAVGILFLIVLPIIGICFCCCRCCCKKCGGKMVQDEEESRKSCKKWTYILILLIVMVFLVVGMVCMLLNNDATSTAIRALPKNTNSNLKDLKVYVNNTVKEATHLIQNNYNFLNTSLNRDLDNIGYLVGLPLRQDIEDNTGVRTTLTNAYSLVTDLDDADTALTDIETKETALKSSVSTMEASLTTVKVSLDGICGPLPFPCPDYATALATDMDSTNFPDLSAPRTSMTSAKSTNMTAKLIEAEEELDGIPDTVVTDSQTSVDDIKILVGNLSNDIDPIMDQIRDINKLFVGSNASIDLDKLSQDVDDFGDTLETFDSYRWLGGLCLAFIIMLFIAFMAAGLILGLIGTNTRTYPANRGRLANCGGIILMAAVYTIFIFAFLLMFLTTLTFMLGAPVHRLACFPITDLDELENVAQVYNDYKVGAGKYFMGDLVMNNETITLTLPGMLRDCRDGKSAYSSFKMAEKFDLADLLNYSKTLDVQSEIDSTNVDLSTISVYPADLQTQLADLKSAVNINFTKFYVELQNNPTAGNLTVLADELDVYAATLTGTDKTDIEAEADNIRTIQATEFADVQAKLVDLNSSVAYMDSIVSSIPTQVDALNDGLNATNIYIQTNTTIVIRSLLNTFASRLTGIADSFTAHTDDGIQTKMGSCLPVWGIYNSMLVYTFCYNLMDTFNGFWFALGWCLFFSMLGLIFSVKLAKYFRRMRAMEWKDTRPNTPIMFDNKVYPEIGPAETKGEWWPQREMDRKPRKGVKKGSKQFASKRSAKVNNDPNASDTDAIMKKRSKNNKLAEIDADCSNSNSLIQDRSRENIITGIHAESHLSGNNEDTNTSKCTTDNGITVVACNLNEDKYIQKNIPSKQLKNDHENRKYENKGMNPASYLLVVPSVDMNEVDDNEFQDIDAFVTGILDKVVEEI